MVDLDTLSSLCKRRGFMFPGSEIYGGIGGFWDYGPLGVELKRNVKDEWWRSIGPTARRNCRHGQRHRDEPTRLGSIRPSEELYRAPG